MSSSASTPPAPDPTPPSPRAAPGPCPRCDQLIPPGAAHGLCPACLLAAGFFTRPGPDARDDSDTPPPTPDELAPEFPALEIIELLGRGGMGAVYKARQHHLGRLVALKLLRPGLDSDPSFAERFTREARALAQLNHPGIVTLHEFGHTPGGRYFIVMEFVDGVNLRQLLAAGRLAPREALAIVPPLCDALQYAHDHGLVHRDIKPENILVDRLGRVKIADFGLAKLAAAGPAANTDTPPIGSWSLDMGHSAESGVMGTPRYMSPEQRDHPAVVDHRTDIYALGVVLYQMLTGELPDEKQLQPPSRRVRLDVRLDEIVLRALEKDPALRYAAASELKTRIETLGGAAPESAPRAKNTPPATASTSAVTPAKSSSGPWLGFATLYLIFVGLLVFTGESLPVRVVRHFDGNGLASGWIARPLYLISMGVAPLLFALFLAAAAGLMRLLPARWINLPHRDHWLAGERRKATATLFGRWMAALACLLVVFCAELHILMLPANLIVPPRLPSGPMLGITIGLLAALMVWLVGLVLRFAEPAIPPRKLRRQNWALGVVAALALLLPAAPLIDEWHDLPARLRRILADPEPTPASDVPAPLSPNLALHLPGGGYVELMGVSAQPSAQTDWWAPDGTPLAPVAWRAEYPASWPITTPSGKFPEGRQFALHADGPGQAPSVLQFQFIGSDGKPSAFTAGLVVAGPRNDTARWSGALMPLRSGDTSASLRILIADGELRRLPANEVILNGSSGGTLHALVSGRKVIVGQIHVREGKAAVDISHELGGETEWRLRAIDSNNRWHTPRTVAGGSSGWLAQETRVFDGLRPADVVELALWTRPAHWVEFTDISLVSGKITAPVVKLVSAMAPAANAPEIQAEVRFILLPRDQFFHPDQTNAAELAGLPGANVLTAPRVTVRSGSDCEITVADEIAKDSPADQRFQPTPAGVSVRLRPTLKDGEVFFDALLTISTPDETTQNLVTTKEFKTSQVCSLDTPLALDFGQNAQGRHQIAVLRFSVVSAPPSPDP